MTGAGRERSVGAAAAGYPSGRSAHDAALAGAGAGAGSTGARDRKLEIAMNQVLGRLHSARDPKDQEPHGRAEALRITTVTATVNTNLQRSMSASLDFLMFASCRSRSSTDGMMAGGRRSGTRSCAILCLIPFQSNSNVCRSQ